MINDLVTNQYLRLIKDYFVFIEEQFYTTNKLYHYCNMDSLLGIIENSTLWMSNVLYQNDRLELSYGRNLLKIILNQKCHDNPLNIKIYERIKLDIEAFFKRAHIFTFSLCENDDQLSQWRGYTIKDKGSVSIGINAYELQEHIVENALLLPVIYDRDKQVKYYETYIDEFVKIMTDSRTISDPDAKFLEYWAVFINQLAIFLITFKSKVFEEEKEWRVIYNSKAMIDNVFFDKEIKRDFKTHFRIKGKYAIPYIEFDLNCESVDNIINSITLGPDTENDDRESNLKYFLNTVGKDITVYKSKINFRQN
jgi:hypothetical protein